MRQPLEDRCVTVSRARFSVVYPANFMLVASMNPCPCGFYNHPSKECLCNPQLVQRYLAKISGPLLDRIDLHVEVTPVEYNELASRSATGEYSGDIRKRVILARERQIQRYVDMPDTHHNAMMPSRLVRRICELDAASESLLKTAMTRLDLSARAYDRILKVSRTIADLDDSDTIRPEHVAEAIQYRSLDKESWAG